MDSDRTFPKGTIFRFYGNELYILAFVGSGECNLINLSSGHFKTDAFPPNGDNTATIPLKSWENGGPPDIVRLGCPGLYGGIDNHIRALLLDNPEDKSKDFVSKLNEKIIDIIRDLTENAK